MADVVSAAPRPQEVKRLDGEGIDGNWTLANTEGEVEDDGGGDDVGEVVALLLSFLRSFCLSSNFKCIFDFSLCIKPHFLSSSVTLFLLED